MCKLCTGRRSIDGAPESRSRRTALGAIAAFSLLGMSTGYAHAYAKSPPKPGNVLSPDQAIKRLFEGNQRYTSGKTKKRDFATTRQALTGGQNPYASILSCADSRVGPELCFDEGRGDLFVSRVAGNYVSTDILASLEYGVAVLNIPVIMVLGHTSCGAVGAAVSAYEKQAEFPGHIQNIVTELMPSVRAAASQAPKGGTLLHAATIENVRQNVQRLQEATPILARAVQDGKLRVVGGVYHLDTGRVEAIT